MTGSTRLTSTASSVRAPYSAPQTLAHSPSSAPQTLAHSLSTARQAATRSSGTPTRNFDTETGASLRLPAPFVPREFRATTRGDVTMVPAAERVEASNAIAFASTLSATPISELFSDGAPQASDFTSFIETHALDESETGSSAELPWIDTFAADEVDPEETWPLDEAGKRLDELTQSLSSLDASRERIEAERLSAEAAVPDAPVHMWNDEEWIDIMPTSASDSAPQDEVQGGVPVNEVAKQGTVSNGSPRMNNAESAACALEGLAQRVRTGELQVPAFSTELGQEAMLAGLLASMLGWRQ